MFSWYVAIKTIQNYALALWHSRLPPHKQHGRSIRNSETTCQRWNTLRTNTRLKPGERIWCAVFGVPYSVCRVSYVLNIRRITVWFPPVTRDVAFVQIGQTWSRANTGSYSVDVRNSVPRGKLAGSLSWPLLSTSAPLRMSSALPPFHHLPSWP
jgi:hypothetical protein